MIVSVSRRTDIPAFYSEWFYNRIADGEVLIRNPFNRKQISRVQLSRDSVDCFVFWTKNPEPMMSKLKLLNGYNYYFQFTLTSYRKDIEANLPAKRDVVEIFRRLVSSIGKERVIWRYDPILINNYYTKEYHYECFEALAAKLHGYTDKCVISFIDNYKETKRNMDKLCLKEVMDRDMLEIAGRLVQIAAKYSISIESCAEKIDLSSAGVSHGQCIDGKLITAITGKNFLNAKKDNIREACNCIKSVDIGEYNSCLHGCAYCYASYNSAVIHRNYASHNKNSKLLLGELQGDERITEHYLNRSPYNKPRCK